MLRFPGQSVLREWTAARRFHALPDESRRIVFYAEDGDSWPHFAPIVRELTGPMGREICYLTSSRTDPALTMADPRIHAFCIGGGAVRTSLFLSMRAGVCVMTMPDLETFHLKRSRREPVHYVYVFHSIVSTHMIYRKGAFDAFDTVLCVGPHHAREISANEELYGFRPKNLVYHGYGRLDSMLECTEARPARVRSASETPHVLVAPSWGPNGLLETRGADVCRALLGAGLRVTVRPHPMTRRKWPECIRSIEQEFAENPLLSMEHGIASFDSLASADCMISDYSGAALEYAFAFEKPVLFVDVPRKVNNPDYERLGIEPLEVSIREKIGRVIAPERLQDLPAEVCDLLATADAMRERIRHVRGDVVYNLGTSGKAAALAVVAAAESTAPSGATCR